MPADKATGRSLSTGRGGRFIAAKGWSMNLEHLGESLHVTESHLPNSRFESVTMSASSFRRAKLDKATFQEADLSGLAISRCDLRNASVQQCKLDDMTIDGIPVTALLAAYRAMQAGRASA